MRKALYIALILAHPSCGGGSNGLGAPSTVSAPTTAPSGPASLTGWVQASAGGGLAGATITILDGANAGRTTVANRNGDYGFDNLTAGNANLTATANGYYTGSGGVFINGSSTLNFPLRTTAFTRSGSGDTVFDLPVSVALLRIQGTCSCGGVNVKVRVAGRLIINTWFGLDLTGIRTLDTVSSINNGGVAEITSSSSGLSWAVTEVREGLDPFWPPT